MRAGLETPIWPAVRHRRGSPSTNKILAPWVRVSTWSVVPCRGRRGTIALLESQSRRAFLAELLDPVLNGVGVPSQRLGAPGPATSVGLAASAHTSARAFGVSMHGIAGPVPHSHPTASVQASPACHSLQSLHRWCRRWQYTTLALRVSLWDQSRCSDLERVYPCL